MQIFSELIMALRIKAHCEFEGNSKMFWLIPSLLVLSSVQVLLIFLGRIYFINCELCLSWMLIQIPKNGSPFTSDVFKRSLYFEAFCDFFSGEYNEESYIRQFCGAFLGHYPVLEKLPCRADFYFRCHINIISKQYLMPD